MRLGKLASVGIRMREVLEGADDFDAALQLAQTIPLIAPAYIMVPPFPSSTYLYEEAIWVRWWAMRPRKALW